LFGKERAYATAIVFGFAPQGMESKQSASKSDRKGDSARMD